MANEDRLIRQWLDESDIEEEDRLEEQEALDNNQEEEDNEQYSEHDTASEDEAEEPDDFAVYTENRIPFVVGKDNLTRWQLHRSIANPRVRRGRCNVITEAAGLKGDARYAVTVIDAWKIFFSDEIIDKIVSDTNRFLQRLRPSMQDLETVWTQTPRKF